MTLLLDTHSLLWFVMNQNRLSAPAMQAICDGTNQVYVSTATAWEIAIKVSIGKLRLNTTYDDFITHAIIGSGFRPLPIGYPHLMALIGMPFHHRDPFDRLLIAQSQVESLTIVTNEALFDRYGVTRLW